MNVRNSYLISHAFRNYLWASLVSSAVMQLTVTVDAIILGHYVGSDALSAISLVMPLTMLVSAISTLIGVGPAIMALVNSVCTTLSHKYMYGQNVVFAEFQSERIE